MSTLKATNIKNESSASNNIVLDSGGGVAVNNGVTLGTGTTVSSPASNTFAVSTNGSERIRIDSSGRFGVGTATITGFSDYTTVHLGSSSSGSALRLVASGDTPGTDDFVIYKNTSGSYLRSYGDPIVFYGNSSEYGRWDTSGRLLVGTDSARENFFNQVSGRGPSIQVEGVNDANKCGIGIVRNSADDNGPELNFGKSRGTSLNSNTSVSNGDGLGRISFQGTDGSELVQAAYIEANVDGTPGTNDMPGRLVFSTTADGASSPTERMRINQKGAVHFSTNGTYTDGNAAYNEIYQTNSNVVALYVRHTGTDPYGFQIVYDQAKNNTGNEFLYCNDSSAQRAVIRSNGGIANYQANNVNLSDINTKKDIAPADGTWDCIKGWEIVNYRYKDQPDDADLNLGVIAQQVAESCPEVITIFQQATENEPEKLGVKEQQMYWMAIKALQEAQERIETLEAKVAALEAQ